MFLTTCLKQREIKYDSIFHAFNITTTGPLCALLHLGVLITFNMLKYYNNSCVFILSATPSSWGTWSNCTTTGCEIGTRKREKQVCSDDNPSFYVETEACVGNNDCNGMYCIEHWA